MILIQYTLLWEISGKSCARNYDKSKVNFICTWKQVSRHLIQHYFLLQIIETTSTNTANK